jgi:hypothetical protein
MGRSASFDPVLIRAAYEKAPGKSRAAKARFLCGQFECSIGTVARALKGRRAIDVARRPGEARREAPLDVAPGRPPATMEHRTLFPSQVFDVGDEWLLKSGENSAKIGKVVTKGAWRGFPIYTLTLEERATCPTSCRHWGSCYGNSTPWARRWRPGPPLEWRLEREVAALELEYPGGFAVRLHNLGDFYSVGYVELWRALLDRHAALHCFGFTARIDSVDDEIAFAVARLVRDRWPRFAIRFSNGPGRHYSTVVDRVPRSKAEERFHLPGAMDAVGQENRVLCDVRVVLVDDEESRVFAPLT